jgi:CRISPR/Cas system-associated exonuclease Cas4 (RecB family)
MKLVTPKGLKDFQTCALLYKYRHEDQLLEKIQSRDLVAERFENTIKEIVYYFFYKKQGGYAPSYSSLLNRWEKLWFSEDVSHYDIITEKHESAYGNNASLTTKAAAILLSFHKNFSDQDFIPISINDECVVPVGRTAKLKYVFDVILAKGKKYYVIKFLFNYKTSHQHMYEVDFAAMKHAYSFKNPTKVKETRFGYIDFAQPKIFFEEYDVDDEDVMALEFWTEEIVNEEAFVPRRGLTWYCKKCPYDKPCSKWKGWKDVKRTE